MLFVALALNCAGPALAQPERDDLIESAKQAYLDGDFESSQDNLRVALTKANQNSLEYAVCLQNLALIEYMNFKFADAEKLYRQALPITIVKCGADSMETANNLYGISRCLRRQNRYAEAEPYLTRILNIRANRSDAKDRLTTNALLDIAVNFNRQNKSEEAILYSSRAVEAHESLVGKDSPLLIPTLKLYSTILHSSNNIMASGVDARIQSLQTFGSNSVVNNSLTRAEDGSTWQNVHRQ